MLHTRIPAQPKQRKRVTLRQVVQAPVLPNRYIRNPSRIEFGNGRATGHPSVEVRCTRNVSPYSLIEDPLLRIEFESEPHEQSSVKVELPVLPRPGQLPNGEVVPGRTCA